MKVEMKSTEYYLSGKQSISIKTAQSMASFRRVSCLLCKKEFPVGIFNFKHTCQPCPTCGSYVSQKRFCSSSCSAKHNNNERTKNGYHLVKRDTTNTKISLFRYHYPDMYIMGEFSWIKKPSSIHHKKTKCSIWYRQCTCCNVLFVVSSEKGNRIHTTCSLSCRNIKSVKTRKYLNGKRLNIYVYNRHTKSIELLESSWEYITYCALDSRNIRWTRPDPLKYHLDKPRYYYPDFYLPDFNLYLDPKNPYALDIGREKMKLIEKQCSIVYGDLSTVLNTINKL